jgi:hypothetical protein
MPVETSMENRAGRKIRVRKNVFLWLQTAIVSDVHRDPVEMIL